MTTFTIVKQYLVPVYASEIIEAETLSEACSKAIESDDWSAASIDYESAGETCVVFAVRGAHANAYDAPACDALRIPPEFAEVAGSLDRDSSARETSGSERR